MAATVNWSSQWRHSHKQANHQRKGNGSLGQNEKAVCGKGAADQLEFMETSRPAKKAVSKHHAASCQSQLVARQAIHRISIFDVQVMDGGGAVPWKVSGGQRRSEMSKCQMVSCSPICGRVVNFWASYFFWRGCCLSFSAAGGQQLLSPYPPPSLRLL